MSGVIVSSGTKSETGAACWEMGEKVCNLKNNVSQSHFLKTVKL